MDHSSSDPKLDEEEAGSNKLNHKYSQTLTEIKSKLDEQLTVVEPDETKRKAILQEVSRVLSVQVAYFETYSYKGPLPDPKMLRQYDEVLPGLHKRIIDRWEKQSDHRMDLEKQIVDHRTSEEKRGQYFGLIIGLACICATVAAFLTGHDTVATVLGGTTVLGLVAIFVVGRFANKKNL